MVANPQPSNPVHQQCVVYTRSCVQCGLDYFKNQINSNLKDSMAVFKSYRLFSPHKIHEIKPIQLYT